MLGVLSDAAATLWRSPAARFMVVILATYRLGWAHIGALVVVVVALLWLLVLAADAGWSAVERSRGGKNF